MADFKNPGIIKFEAPLRNEDPESTNFWIEFPYSVEELFGVKGRVPVNVTFDGISYRGSLVKYKSSKHLLLILKSVNQQLGKKAGDNVAVTVELDTVERKVELAADILNKLKMHPAAMDTWSHLSYTHQREYHQWLESAVKPETRARRAEKMLKMLIEKKVLS